MLLIISRDIIFANGEYQIKELRELEKLNNSKPKEIFPTGYMYFDYLAKIENIIKTIYYLLHQSYSKNNCLDKYGFELISNLMTKL